MSLEDSFPPIDPVSSLEGPWIVVPRRRRFGSKSREEYNQLLQSQSELSELSEPGSRLQAPVPPAVNPPENIPHFDQLA